MKRYRLAILVAAATVIVAGCGPSKSQLAETVEARVAASLATTGASWPTFIPASTYTPQPTYTARPTRAPANTDTPLPTYTPRPVFTPNPTYTTQPSPSPSKTALVVAVVQPGHRQSSLLGPSYEMVFDEISIKVTRGSITEVLYYLFPRCYGCEEYWIGSPGDQNAFITEGVACPELITAYDRLIGRIIPRPSGEDTQMQTAYDIYERAVILFQDSVSDLVSGCRIAAVDGNTLGPLPDGQEGIIRDAEVEAKQLLQQAMDILAGR